jgi:hypothetical protein
MNVKQAGNRIFFSHRPPSTVELALDYAFRVYIDEGVPNAVAAASAATDLRLNPHQTIELYLMIIGMGGNPI